MDENDHLWIFMVELLYLLDLLDLLEVVIVHSYGFPMVSCSMLQRFEAAPGSPG